MHPVPTATNLSLELFHIEGTNFQLAQRHLTVPTNAVSTALKPNDSLEGNLLLSLLNTPVRQNRTYNATKSSTRVAMPRLRLYPGPCATLTAMELQPHKAVSLPQLKRHSEIPSKIFSDLKSCFILVLNDPFWDLQLSGTVLRSILLKSLEMFLQLLTINSLECHSVILSSIKLLHSLLRDLPVHKYLSRRSKGDNLAPISLE